MLKSATLRALVAFLLRMYEKPVVSGESLDSFLNVDDDDNRLSCITSDYSRFSLVVSREATEEARRYP